MSQNGVTPSPARKNRLYQTILRRTPERLRPSQAEAAPRLLDVSQEEKNLVVYQVGTRSVTKHEPKSHTSLL